MSLLGIRDSTFAATNPWASRVLALGATRPWWSTESVIGVAEVRVKDVGTFVVHVARSKTGRMFASAPSAKRGDNDWVRAYSLDAQLQEAVGAAAINAVQTMIGAPVDDGAALPV